MIEHYFKLAWRQLLKYKLQSLVSIVSLAIGFACFALASMWIKYETTYDAFHKDAEKIHILLVDEGKYVRIGTQSLQALPEFELLAYAKPIEYETINGEVCKITTGYATREFLMCDTNFVSLFGMDMLEGSKSFIFNEREVAISDRLAKHLFGEDSPIGQELRVEPESHTTIPALNSRTVVAVFKSWGRHSNFKFDILGRMPEDVPVVTKSRMSGRMFAHISPKVDLQSLNARLDTMYILPDDIERYSASDIAANRQLFTHLKVSAVPITKMRHSTNDYINSGRAKINHIYLFAMAGGMLILCGLLNYLTMFINRLFIRKREIALRSVFGASGINLMIQFLIEYGLLLAFAMFLGNYFLKISLTYFLDIVEIPRNMGYIYRESFTYMSLVVVVSLLVSLPPIWYFRRQSLQSSITGVGGLSNYNTFRRISTGFQMAIAIFSLFCTVVLMKQLDTLRHGDIGFERENRGIFSHYAELAREELYHFLKQQPEVDTAFLAYSPIYPTMLKYSWGLTPKNYPQLTKPIQVDEMEINEGIAKFYGLTLLAGRWPNEEETDCIVINETLAKKLGWKDAIGKITHRGRVVIGVVKDFLIESPTTPPQPFILSSVSKETTAQNSLHILYSFKPEGKASLQKKLEEHLKMRSPNMMGLFSGYYDEMLESERNLQKLLNITSIVCILIALFGVWSMIMLTCEQRRKEIAIRKVFGATVKDILDMFFLEYMTLQGVAALIAFPSGYVCMKPWLEQYVVQTSIPWWIYVGIFLAVALLVALCVGWRVWKTAKAHPADEIAKGRG